MRSFLESLPMLLAAGIAGGLHCAGMCGGLALLVTGARTSSRAWAFVPYLAGKAWSYALLGGLAGAIGHTVLRAAPLGIGMRALALVSGCLLLLLGLQLLGVWPATGAGLGWLRPASGLFAGIAREGGPWGGLLLGAVNGFLPCPLVYAFLGMAAATGSVPWGAFTGLMLGLTSALPLGLCALGGHALKPLAGRRLPQLGGMLMLLMALVTLFRGLATTGAHH